jgi:hypothetical protein
MFCAGVTVKAPSTNRKGACHLHPATLRSRLTAAGSVIRSTHLSTDIAKQASGYRTDQTVGSWLAALSRRGSCRENRLFVTSSRFSWQENVSRPRYASIWTCYSEQGAGKEVLPHRMERCFPGCPQQLPSLRAPLQPTVAWPFVERPE